MKTQQHLYAKGIEMKKILATSLVMLFATSALAHRDCITRTDRYGNRYTKCKSHTHRNDHRDNYGDGFFDGLIASSVTVLTSSDIVDGDDKMEAIRSEASLTLSLMSEGMEDAISADLSAKIEEIRANNEAFANASDAEVLEAIILAE